MAKYHMHKIENEIKEYREIDAILREGKFATLALCREKEPYVVTMNYGYDSETRVLFFHCATDGLKLDFVRSNPRACGTVILDDGYGHGRCTHAYRSVVFWGQLEIVNDTADKRAYLERMIECLEADPEPVRQRLLSNSARLETVEVLQLAITEITGKRGL